MSEATAQRRRRASTRPAMSTLHGGMEPGTAWLAAFALAWGLISVAAFASPGPLVGVAIGLAPVVLLVLSLVAWFRAIVVIVGGMVVLGSGSDVGANKVVYAVLLVACTAVSTWQLVAYPPPWGRTFRILFPVGLVLALTLVVGVLYTTQRTEPTTTIRQSLFYFLILVAPIVGLDSARSMKP